MFRNVGMVCLASGKMIFDNVSLSWIWFLLLFFIIFTPSDVQFPRQAVETIGNNPKKFSLLLKMINLSESYSPPKWKIHIFFTSNLMRELLMTLCKRKKLLLILQVIIVLVIYCATQTRISSDEERNRKFSSE